MSERPVRDVPRAVLVVLLLSVAAQIAWHGAQPSADARAEALPPAPSLPAARAMSFGDELVLSRILSLWLQAFDNQSGISVSFNELDFDKVENWLALISQLDPRSQYPFLSASRVYAGVSDPAKKRQMLEFVYKHFKDDPNVRWPWLAHASIIARHQLKDLDLALRYARAITDLAVSDAVPAWARDMSVILLADMGEAEAAKVLIGALMDSGRVTDQHELRYLTGKLEELEQSVSGAAQTPLPEATQAPAQ